MEDFELELIPLDKLIKRLETDLHTDGIVDFSQFKMTERAVDGN